MGSSSIFMSARSPITGDRLFDVYTRFGEQHNPLDLRNVLKLDRNPYGLPQPYPLPLTKGYFNGCLLTVTSGPAAGQSTRILEYECLVNPTPASGATTSVTRLFRFRVMAFPAQDGQPFIPSTTTRALEMKNLPELRFEALAGSRSWSTAGRSAGRAWGTTRWL